MKKILVAVAIAVIISILTGCGESKQGTLLGESSKLNNKERNEVPFLWSGEVFADVKLNNGDTIHAAINADSMKAKILRNDRAVTIVIDGEHNDFYFVK